MISVWLRCCLVAEAAGLILLWVLLETFAGWPTAVEGVAALAILIGLNAAAVLVKYIISRRQAFVPPAELEIGTAQAIAAAAEEVLAFLAVFGVIQPFERWWMKDDAIGRLSAGRRPVLLVHGYLCNRGLWWWLRRRLRARGIAAATINLEPPLGGIDGFAEALAARIDQLLAETAADRVVLVAHSMGGLAARAYLRRHGADKVARLVTLATPHHGTLMARLGPGQNAREMQPGSPWLRELARGEEFAVPVTSIWGARDEIVVPQDGGRLSGARDKVLPAAGHLAMVFSSTVLNLIEIELDLPP
jgi:triacylglycerol lipase